MIGISQYLMDNITSNRAPKGLGMQILSCGVLVANVMNSLSTSWQLEGVFLHLLGEKIEDRVGGLAITAKPSQ